MFHEKKYYFNFFIVLREVASLLAKKYWHGCQNCNLSTFARFWGITFFLEKEHDFNLLRALRWKKRGLSVEKFSLGFTEQKLALPEKIFEEKNIFPSKMFYFSVIIFGVGVILCLFANFFSQVCQTANQREERKKIGEINLEKLCYSINFWLWAEKTWSFSKTVKHDSQKLSLHEQLNIFRKVYGSKKICMKGFGHWTETSDFWRKLLLRAAKGAIQVSSATFQKKMIKVKFTVCGFFRTLCDSFSSDRKSGTRCQNQKIGVQSKKVGRTFLSRMFFETFSDFEQKNLEI